MDDLISSGQIVDLVYKYGALPLLIFAVWVLWNKTDKMEGEIAKLNESQKTDLRSHGEEVKGIQQSTINTLNEYKSSLDGIISKIDEFLR